MIRIPEELAIQIEEYIDVAFEKAKKQFPLKDEIWASFESTKEDILCDLAEVGDNIETVLQDSELKNHLIHVCVKLGLIYRLERYANPDFGPLTIV